MKMQLGYIIKALTSGPTDKNTTYCFKLMQAPYIRTISKTRDTIKSKILCRPVPYEDVQNTTDWMKETDTIVIQEPFFLDKELFEKVTKWIEWANTVDSSKYSFLSALTNN